MHGDLQLRDIILVLGLAVAVVSLLHRIRIPAIAGYILVGIVAGPSGLSLISSSEDVQSLAELGVVLLLFSIGLEFSIHRLRRTWRLLLEGGIPYVVLIAAAVYLAATVAGFSRGGAAFAGFWIALSSTAIVLKTLASRGEVDSPSGRLVISILLFQDLCIVPMMLLLPVLAGAVGGSDIRIAEALARALFILLVVLFVSRYVVPPFLAYVAHTRNRELFLMLVLLICIGTAAVSGSLGLSAALGAFLAGILLSKSDYGMQALADILPFRDVFSSVFFVSVGMLLDLRFVAAHPLEVLGIGTAIIAGKGVIGTAIVRVLGYPMRVASLAGVALSQVGEFSFVLASAGRGMNLLPERSFQTLLAASALTMVVTPILISLAPRVARRVERVEAIGPDRMRGRRVVPGEPAGERFEGHVVIVGYGLNGRNLARLLSAQGIPYLILELNARTVREAQSRGEPILFGDATSEAVLERLGLDRARAAVISISDPEATRRTVRSIRTRHADIYILVRTRFVAEVDELHALGANEVVPEEFETSIEIGARVLARFGAPIAVIRRRLAEVRADRYRAFRPASAPPPQAVRGHVEGAETETYELPEDSPVVGMSLSELDLAGRTGGLLLALVRGDERMTHPNLSLVLEAGDVVVLLGNGDQLDAARGILAGEIAVEDSETGAAAPQGN